jgi:nitroreductase
VKVLDRIERITLPRPHLDGSMALERCIAQRRPVRHFRREALTKSQLGQLLWAGHAAQNLMLQAVALGLASTMVGAFDDEEVARLLRLGAAEKPLCLIPVGAP